MLTLFTNNDIFVLTRQRTPTKKLCQQQQQKETNDLLGPNQLKTIQRAREIAKSKIP